MSVMKIAAAFVCLLLAADAGLAQNYYRAIQQAKRDSAQNDAEQQRIQREAGGQPAGQPAVPNAPAAPPMDPAMVAALNNVTNLQTDFSKLNGATSDTPDPAQKISLLNNLSQAGQGTKKASADSVKKLADDLLTAINGKKKLTSAQQVRLAREIHALFNSSHLSAAQQISVVADVQKTLTDGGASLDDAVNVATDLKEIVAQTK